MMDFILKIIQNSSLGGGGYSFCYLMAGRYNKTQYFGKAFKKTHLLAQTSKIMIIYEQVVKTSTVRSIHVNEPFQIPLFYF